MSTFLIFFCVDCSRFYHHLIFIPPCLQFMIYLPLLLHLFASIYLIVSFLPPQNKFPTGIFFSFILATYKPCRNRKSYIWSSVSGIGRKIFLKKPTCKHSLFVLLFVFCFSNIYLWKTVVTFLPRLLNKDHSSLLINIRPFC